MGSLLLYGQFLGTDSIFFHCFPAVPPISSSLGTAWVVLNHLKVYVYHLSSSIIRAILAILCPFVLVAIVLSSISRLIKSPVKFHIYIFFNGDLLCIYRLVSSFRSYMYFSNASGAEISVCIYNSSLNAVLYYVALEVCFIPLSYSLAFAVASAILKYPVAFVLFL